MKKKIWKKLQTTFTPSLIILQRITKSVGLASKASSGNVELGMKVNNAEQNGGISFSTDPEIYGNSAIANPLSDLLPTTIIFAEVSPAFETTKERKPLRLKSNTRCHSAYPDAVVCERNPERCPFAERDIMPRVK